ncbi:S-layer homology domain-containing protein [Cohnella cellulosilytica]|uniref:S-layer homology domain-containing protein n=1 Tax=Cohnella cellulosilytica TaxID=986710 RepID=A0ABW2FBX8_9BACL
MKQMQPVLKKTAAATLALAMLAGSATAAMASAKSDQGSKNRHDDKRGKNGIHLNYKDVNGKEWKWAYGSIVRLASQGVFNGYGDGSFKPRNNISRIEALVAAVRLLGLKEEAEKPENANAKLNFKDFAQLKKKYGWAVGYVAVALENDLFSETDAAVEPDKPATRLWASVLLVKAMKLEGEAKQKMDTELPFRDAKEIPAGSVGYIAVALEKNLIKGYDDKTFQPNRPVTRAELASLLDRVDRQLPEEGRAQAIVGKVETVAGNALTVRKADGTAETVAFDGSVFIFRDNVKAPISALQPGDEVLVRTYEGKAVFIEVTKTAAASAQFVDSGTLGSFTLGPDGKLATISVHKTSDGVTHIIIYDVDPNATISGGAGLSPNANVVVRGSNNIVKTIEIQA